MKIREISWTGEFSCLCGDCPQTCCRGWVIPLEERDCARLKKTKGKLGLSLFFATAGWTRAKFNTDSGRCPFHDADGLCRIQKEKGHEYIPWTCQSYPRFYRNYGYFEETCVDISCIGAARLFLAHLGELDIIESEGDPKTRVCTTNEDRPYIEFLLTQRKEIMDMTATVFGEAPIEDISVPERCGRFVDELFAFAAKLQAVSSKGNEEMLKGLDLLKEIEKDGPGKYSGTPYGFPLPAGVFGELLSSSLCHIRLKTVDPKLYEMISRAKEYMSRQNADALMKAASDMHLIKILGAYLSYYIYQYFLRTYETYSFRRQMALGIIHMNMIFLFAAETAGRETLTDETVAGIISHYNRRAYFNEFILDDMYRIYENNLPKARPEKGG
ncbi:MAG: flagellin lysine-N-methylase [Lachnospiraceae bacterium]|nr:flagellin lysine-N-methylase [Lachnospiraceae bacterium]